MATVDRLHAPHHDAADAEAAVWVLIIVLLALSCAATLILLEKVAG